MGALMLLLSQWGSKLLDFSFELEINLAVLCVVETCFGSVLSVEVDLGFVCGTCTNRTRFFRTFIWRSSLNWFLCACRNGLVFGARIN